MVLNFVTEILQQFPWVEDNVWYFEFHNKMFNILLVLRSNFLEFENNVLDFEFRTEICNINYVFLELYRPK